MSDNYMSFEAFSAAAKDAPFYYVRPYGIYHNGEVYWDKRLPRRKGAVVRFFEDPSGPCLSLTVFDMDGNYLCSAYPISWHEDDHPAQHEMQKWWDSLSEEEREYLRKEFNS